MCLISCYPYDRNNERRNIVTVIPGARGPQGPQGPQGPVGPQGPQGAPAISDAIYANYAGGAITTGSIIPLTVSATTPASTQTASGGSLILPSGIYLVSYFADGTVSADNLSTTLYLNGAALPNEILTQTNEAGAYSAASKTVLLNLPSGGTLSLYNTSPNTATLSGASITSVKIA